MTDEVKVERVNNKKKKIELDARTIATLNERISSLENEVKLTFQ